MSGVFFIAGVNFDGFTQATGVNFDGFYSRFLYFWCEYPFGLSTLRRAVCYPNGKTNNIGISSVVTSVFM